MTALSPDDLRLYLVADPAHCSGSVIDAVSTAIRNGVTAVQLRARHLGDREQLDLARQLRAVCRRNGTRFLVNDRFDIAMMADADGMHLGVSDIRPADIRRVARDGFLIGYSPESMNDANVDDADYLGIGPVFGTTSKVDAGPALGIEEFSARVIASSRPVVGIGGITSQNARSVIESGAVGIAAISSILGANDVGASTRQLRTSLG